MQLTGMVSITDNGDIILIISRSDNIDIDKMYIRRMGGTKVNKEKCNIDIKSSNNLLTIRVNDRELKYYIDATVRVDGSIEITATGVNLDTSEIILFNNKGLFEEVTLL